MTGTARRHIVLVQAGLGAGGTEKIVAMIAARCSALGDRVTVLSITGSPETAYYDHGPAVRIRSMQAERKGRAYRSTARRTLWLRRVLRELSPDLVISFLTKINIQTAVASAGLGIPLIASERNNFLKQPMSRVWRQSLPYALGHADTIVMQTRASTVALPPDLLSRVRIIPNPVQLPPGEKSRKSDPRSLVSVGRLTHQKGFDLLLRAMASVVDTDPSVRLTIWGEGELRHELEARRRSYSLDNAVALPGRTPIPHGWIESGGIFVLSSRYEGFANVLIEAMGAGMAVIAFDCPWGPAELLSHEKTGLLVPAEDTAALSGAIKRVLVDDELRTRLGKAAAEASAAYAPDRIWELWSDVIESTCRDAEARRHHLEPRWIDRVLNHLPRRPGAARRR